jgi:hypothetical protein
MNRILLLLILFTAATLLVGCGGGMVSTPEERYRRITRIDSIYERQLVDDSDEFWFADENLHLSQWTIRVAE